MERRRARPCSDLVCSRCLLCPCLCVGVHTHAVHVWVWMCTHVSVSECGGQKTTSDVILHVPSILLSHWDLGLTDEARLPGQHLGI